MGAPKQKWTAEEEAALKAGIQKYGAGKWSTILKDPEFNVILRSRSNVDLKDKWRNLNCMASGLGSRHRASVAHKSSQLIPKQEEDTTVRTMEVEKDAFVLYASPLAASSETDQDFSSRKRISRPDDVILEAITKLKEPRGSSRHSIKEYIEEHYFAPPDFDRTLNARLKLMTEEKQLFKVKHQYRIALRSTSLTIGKYPQLSFSNGAKNDVEAQSNGLVILTKAQFDSEMEKMKNMTAEEAIAAAAQAVAEAEAAITAAEVAAREAEEAEAEAEAARCFAEATERITHSSNLQVISFSR